MLQLGQLNLQLALVSSCSLSKNIQNQASSIQHTALELSLEVALLTGGQVVVEDNNLCITTFDQIADFFQLAGTYKKFGMGRLAGTSQKFDRIATSGDH